MIIFAFCCFLSCVVRPIAIVYESIQEDKRREELNRMAREHRLEESYRMRRHDDDRQLGIERARVSMLRKKKNEIVRRGTVQ